MAFITDGFQFFLDFSVYFSTKVWHHRPSEYSKIYPRITVVFIGPRSSCFGWCPAPCALSCGSLPLLSSLAASRSFLQFTLFPFSCGCSASSIYCIGHVSLPLLFPPALPFSSWHFSFIVPFVRPLLKSSDVVFQWQFYFLIFLVLFYISLFLLFFVLSWCCKPNLFITTM